MPKLEDISESELAEISALIVDDPLVEDKPILLISRWTDGTVVVKTGYVIAPLHAYGDLLRLRSEAGRFVVVDRGRWGS